MDLTPDEGCKGAIPVVLIGVEACGEEDTVPGGEATVRYGPRGIPMGPLGPSGGPWGAGALFHFSQFSGFGPGRVPWKVSVAASVSSPFL